MRFIIGINKVSVQKKKFYIFIYMTIYITCMYLSVHLCIQKKLYMQREKKKKDKRVNEAKVAR